MQLDWHDPEAVLLSMGRHIGLWRWEFSTDRVQWSDHLLEMLGIDRSDYTDHYNFFDQRLHPDDKGLVEDRIRDHLTTGAPYRFRCRLLHEDGHYITTLAQGSAIRDSAGKASELVGTVLDITNEIHAEQRLSESERSFQSMAENVPGAIFRYILKPDGTDEIEYMSSGCYDIWELTAEQIQGDPSALWAAVFEEDLPAMQASVAESATNLSQWHHRWRMKTPSGRVKHLDGRGVPSRREDGSTLWNSLILDVTSEVEIADELLRQQRMLGQAQKMEAIGRISGGIAHDFNNILAVMVGGAQLLEDTEAKEQRADLASEIVDAGKRGSQLTRQLLSFARRSTLNPATIDLNHSIKGMSALVARVLPESISLETVLGAGLWKAEIDNAFFENCILNLCINSRDAMPNGGRLTIETSNVRVTSDYARERAEDIDPGRYVLIAVTDTGVGIPETELEKVTEPFYSTKAPELGSGLGLAMVDGFVRQSNGTLRIYSEIGVGTSIKVYLPAVEAVDQPSEPDPTAEDREGQSADAARILVVEDEEGIRKIVELTLSRSGYSVSVASSGDDAMRRYGDQIEGFDLLLTDVVMPGDTQGPALAARLLERAPQLKVIFMSGYPNEAAIHGNGLRASDLFLMKPVMRADLLRTVAEAIGS